MYCVETLRTIAVTVFVKHLIDENWHPDSWRFSRLLYRGCCAIPWPTTTTVAGDGKTNKNTIKRVAVCNLFGKRGLISRVLCLLCGGCTKAKTRAGERGTLIRNWDRETGSKVECNTVIQ